MIKIAILQKLSDVADQLESAGFIKESNELMDLMIKISEFDDSQINPNLMSEIDEIGANKELTQEPISREIDGILDLQKAIERHGAESLIEAYVDARDSLVLKIKDVLRSKGQLPEGKNNFVVYWNPSTQNFETNSLNKYLESGKRGEFADVCVVKLDGKRISYEEPFWDIIYSKSNKFGEPDDDYYNDSE